MGSEPDCCIKSLAHSEPADHFWRNIWRQDEHHHDPEELISINSGLADELNLDTTDAWLEYVSHSN